MIINIISAIIIGGVVFLCYGLSRSSEDYSLRYNVSLFLITIMAMLILSAFSVNIFIVLVVLLILLIVGFIIFRLINRSDEVYFLFIRAGRESERKLDSFMNEVYKGMAQKKSCNVYDEYCELIYQMTGRMLRKRVNGLAIREALYAIDSVSFVDIRTGI